MRNCRNFYGARHNRALAREALAVKLSNRGWNTDHEWIAKEMTKLTGEKHTWRMIGPLLNSAKRRDQRMRRAA